MVLLNTFVANWLSREKIKTLYIEPGSPWENGYCESFNSKLRDELLAREIFYTMKEAKSKRSVNVALRCSLNL